MSGNGYARIMYDDDGVYFRIEAVPRSQFTSLLDLFLTRFPTRVWNEEKRAWQLSHHQFVSLIKFAVTTFGKEHVVVDRAPRQIPLPFLFR